MPLKPLIDANAIAERVAELGRAITHDFLGEELVVVPVLKGSYVFAADLLRHIDLDVAIDFLGVRSYGNQQESSGVVQITTDLSHSIEGKHVILVEDIVDTGLTVSYLYENLATRQPASVKIASLLHKPSRITQNRVPAPQAFTHSSACGDRLPRLHRRRCVHRWIWVGLRAEVPESALPGRGHRRRGLSVLYCHR